MNWRKRAGIACVCGLMSCLTLSAKEEETPSPRVAGIFSTKTNYWKEMLRGVEEGCEELDFSFFYLDVSLQDKDAMTWEAEDAWNLALLSDVDAIIADGNVPNIEVVKQAREKGIFIVLVDSDPGEELRDAYVGTDNVQAGRLAVETLEKLYGITDDPIMVQLDYDINAVYQRSCGIREALEQKWSKIKIESLQTPWYFERIFNSSLEKLLEENPDLQAIFGLMESETKLYAQIIKRLKLSDKIHLIAFDIFPGIEEFLQDGTIDAVVVQESYEIGYQSAQTVGKLMDGRALDQDVIYIECSVVSKEDLPFWDMGVSFDE